MADEQVWTDGIKYRLRCIEAIADTMQAAWDKRDPRMRWAEYQCTAYDINDLRYVVAYVRGLEASNG